MLFSFPLLDHNHGCGSWPVGEKVHASSPFRGAKVVHFCEGEQVTGGVDPAHQVWTPECFQPGGMEVATTGGGVGSIRWSSNGRAANGTAPEMGVDLKAWGL